MPVENNGGLPAAAIIETKQTNVNPIILLYMCVYFMFICFLLTIGYSQVRTK
ncbi:MAG TPA: hypothetical protein DCE74_09205 [Porphyromonadaceae bacterium]|nr:hypothetical protein [Porphyromonadaceae bacterium]